VVVALHLAHAREDPTKERRRQGGGGGGGDDFYAFVGRIYKDDRATPLARELLLALAYASHEHPGDGPEQWALVRRALGRSRGGQSRTVEAVIADAPRYVPPGYDDAARDPYQHVCRGPRVRPYKSRMDFSGWDSRAVSEWQERDADNFRNREKVCGDSASDIKVVEKALDTGWWTIRYFCKRHLAEAERLREQLREQNEQAPPPIPNRGGLLPSYFDSDWLSAYRKARGGRYAPPVYGLRADDWPVSGRQPDPARPRLRLVAPIGFD
jgi:hypothetical protein